MQRAGSCDPEGLEARLLDLVRSARGQASEDPFCNPVLAVTLAITRRFDRGEITGEDLDGLFVRLHAAALGDRAARLCAYVGPDLRLGGPSGGRRQDRVRQIA